MDWHRWTVSQLLFWRERTITTQLRFINYLGTEQEAQVSNRCKQHKSDQRNKWTHPGPDVVVCTSTQQGGMQQNRFSSECWREENETCKVWVGWVFFVLFFICCGFEERRRKSRENISMFLGTLFITGSAGRRAMPAGIPTMQHQSPLIKILLQGLTQGSASMRSLLSHIRVGQGKGWVSFISHFNIFYSVSRCHVLVPLRACTHALWAQNTFQCNNKSTNLTKKKSKDDVKKL